MANYLLIRQPILSVMVALTYLILHAITATGLRTVSIQHNLPPYIGSITIDKESLVSPGLVYGSCNNNPRNKSQDNCTFVMETNSYVNLPEHLILCNFTLKAFNETKLGNLRAVRKVIAIGEDKAALITEDPFTFTTLTILNFTECTAVPVDIGDIENIKVQAPFDDIFDAVLISPENEVSRIVLDFEGNIVTRRRVHWIGEYNAIATVHTLSKGRLIVDTERPDEISEDRSKVQIWAVKEERSEKVLKEYPVDKTRDLDKKYTVSTIHQLLSVCTLYNSLVTCGQFDLNGVQKFEVGLKIADPSEIFTLRMYNLAEGGFLLLIFEYNDSTARFEPTIKHFNYFIVNKVNATGQLQGSLRTARFHTIDECTIDNFHFFENEEKEKCLSLVRTGNVENGKVSLKVVCFADGDFFL